ncbi:hypothetical protein N7481_001515 [Penicillium waksmanii]|uniref:uncharacterized protein n=1 Tax=Penicillium waksmanii TaxID=69791 RepID=UPI002546B8BE|nr:uncharacterized protein N7481_001515 [Penicillium waksmanii]KAJ6001106.1 hypothetical protein N7481_001515 [Penicillium waksmanii]
MWPATWVDVYLREDEDEVEWGAAKSYAQNAARFARERPVGLLREACAGVSPIHECLYGPSCLALGRVETQNSPGSVPV